MSKKDKVENSEVIKRFFDDGFYEPTRTIYIGDVYGEIEDGLCADVFKAVHIFEEKGNQDINIFLNTYGGCCASSLAIYERLKNSACRINIDVYGACMSGGSIILQAGDWRRISKKSVFMIHDGDDFYQGVQKNFEAWADFSKTHYRKYLYEIYYSKMRKQNRNMTMKKIESMCTLDNIFTAQETVKLGLADVVI